MKQWWQELSLREKQTLFVGGIIVLCFFAYAWLWSPLEQRVKSMREQLIQQQALLQWMKKTDKTITLLESTLSPLSENNDGSSLLSLTQHQLKTASPGGHYSECLETDSGGVHLTFKAVAFDQLIRWLTTFSQQHPINISDFSVSASDTPGIVSADFIIQSF